MRQLIMGLGLLAAFGLVGCGGDNSSEASPENFVNDLNDIDNITKVDGSPVFPDSQGIQLVDEKNNVITTYISNEIPSSAVAVESGIDLGAPSNYQIITNGFIKITYSDLLVGAIQTIRVTPSDNFNTILVYDETEDLLEVMPYVDIDGGGSEFRIKPIEGNIIFALFNLEEGF